MAKKKKQRKTKNNLRSIQANATNSKHKKAIGKSWYSIQAKGAQTADVNIYEEIGYWGVTAQSFVTDIKALGDVKLINLHINSPGGSVIDGTAIYNVLKNHEARIVVHIDGAAFSMGSLIAMSGDHINMAANGLMMVHNPQGGTFGEAKDLRKTADIIDKMATNMVNTYAGRTGIDAETVTDLLNEETWMNAEEALDFGFIDEITGEIEVAANFDLNKFDNVPMHVLAQYIGKKPSENYAAEDIVNAVNEAIDDASHIFLANETSAVADTTKVDTIMPLTEEQKKAAEATAKAEAEEKAKVIAKQAADDALAKEGSRQTSIRSVFAAHGDNFRVELDKCLDDQETTVEAAREILLDAIGKKTKATPTGDDVRIEMIADQREKFRAGVSEAISIRMGNTEDKGSNEFRGHTLLDIAKASLKLSNVSMAGMDKMRIVGAAFTHSTSDFPYLLENSLGKELQRAYGEFDETWRDIAYVSSVPDFKVNSRIRLGSFNSLDVVPEGGEYKSGSFGEEKETIQAQTKGKMISLTRQMIINDDLNGFMRIAGLMGRAAARTVGNDVYGIITDNAALFDGVALFHATHNNLAGSGAAPTIVTLGAARTAMRKQMDPDSNDYLDIRPIIIVCGVELEDTINTLMASETDPSQANSKKPNIFRRAFKVVADPRLNATEWYLLANPNEVPTLEIAFLDGNQTPYLESQMGFTVDGTAWKVRLDYGTTGNDFRGGYKNAGA